jgi:hypothetical protein
LPLFVEVIEERELKYFLDHIVHGEELPAHAEQEDLRVPMSYQNLINCLRKVLILALFSSRFCLIFNNNLIYYILLLLWFQGYLVKLLIGVI